MATNVTTSSHFPILERVTEALGLSMCRDAVRATARGHAQLRGLAEMTGP